MIRAIIFSVFLFIGFSSFSQTQLGTSFKSGFDRIGLYFDQTLNIDMNMHEVDFGLRYYGPDFVFEKDVLGLSMAYSYNFYTKNEKIYFGPGISGTFFRENKTTTEFYLSDFMVFNKIGYHLTYKLSIFGGPAFGMVVNKINSYVSGESQTVAYFNYEFHLGIRYNWRTRVNDDMIIDEMN